MVKRMNEEFTTEQIMDYVTGVIEDERSKNSKYCYFYNLPDEIVYILKDKGYNIEQLVLNDFDTLENNNITCVFI